MCGMVDLPVRLLYLLYWVHWGVFDHHCSLPDYLDWSAFSDPRFTSPAVTSSGMSAVGDVTSATEPP